MAGNHEMHCLGCNLPYFLSRRGYGFEGYDFLSLIVGGPQPQCIIFLEDLIHEREDPIPTFDIGKDSLSPMECDRGSSGE